MSKARKEKQRLFLVRMKHTYTSYVEVLANDAEDARELADAGPDNWTNDDASGELIDWEAIGVKELDD